MKILTVTHKLTKKHEETLRKFVGAVFDKDELTIVDVHVVSAPDPEDYDLVLTFGTRAYNEIINMYDSVVPEHVHKFPSMTKLDKDTGTREERVLALEELKLVSARQKLVLPKPIEIPASEFKSFSPEHLEDLKKLIQERGCFETKLESGKTLTIYNTLPATTTSDIALTLSEVFLYKFLADMMGIKSFSIKPFHN